MKFFIATFATAIVACFLQFFLPWWSVAIAAFVCSYCLTQSAWRSFASGFVGVFMLWGGYAAWLDAGNQHILATRVSALLQLPNFMALILVTAILGGLVGGLAALAAYFLKKNPPYTFRA